MCVLWTCGRVKRCHSPALRSPASLSVSLSPLRSLPLSALIRVPVNSQLRCFHWARGYSTVSALTSWSLRHHTQTHVLTHTGTHQRTHSAHMHEHAHRDSHERTQPNTHTHTPTPTPTRSQAYGGKQTHAQAHACTNARKLAQTRARSCARLQTCTAHADTFRAVTYAHKTHADRCRIMNAHNQPAAT
jgi:hypothetical protein